VQTGVALALLALLGLTAACGDDDGTPETAPVTEAPQQERRPALLVVDPAGTGEDCTAVDPCAEVSRAAELAQPGDTIALEPGEYPARVYVGPADEDAEAIEGGFDVVTSGGEVRLADVVVRAHDVVLQGITVTGAVRTLADDEVRGLELRDSVIDGGVVLFNGVRGGVVADNEFEDGLNSDALNIKDGSEDIEVVGNVFHDYRHDPEARNAEIHVDCIQVFGATDVRIVGNRFDNCSQRAIMIQVAPGSPLATRDIVVENNVIGGCDPDELCQTANVPFQATGAIEGSAPGEGYRIVNNLIDGFAFIEPVPGLVFANNVLDRYFHTDSDVTVCDGDTDGVGNNLVGEQTGCPALPPDDRLGVMRFVTSPFRSFDAPDVEDPDTYGFADADVAPPGDILGREACGPRDVGPYEFGC
jgi:hypothetical protein